MGFKSSLIFILLFGLILIPLISAENVQVTLPRDVVGNVTCGLMSGGSLDANTTYYATVINQDAYRSPSYATTGIARWGYHSPLSEICNFTTTDTHKSYWINFTSAPDETTTGNNYHDNYYDVLLTKIQNDWTNSGGYYGASEYSYLNNPMATAGNYTFAEENNNTFMQHSANRINDWWYDSYGINKSLGIIKVSIDDVNWNTANPYGYLYSAQKIYEEVVNAGYSDYIYWNNKTLVLKGWIVLEGSNATILTFKDIDLIFLKGGLHVNNPNAVVTFGSYIDEYQGADYDEGCNLILFNSRYPIRGLQGTLNYYGGSITASNYLQSEEIITENLAEDYYDGGSQLYMAYDISGFKDVQLASYIRGVTSQVKDLKVGIGNNWHNEDSYNLEITNNRIFCYSSNCDIYDTSWLTSLSGSSGLRTYVPASCAFFSTNIYNGLFSYYDDNIPPIHYFITNYGCLYAESFQAFWNTLKISVTDRSGNYLEGVSIACNNSKGNGVNWTEYNTTSNYHTKTGNIFEYNVTTDSNGQIEYYLLSYNVTLNQSNDISSSFNDNINKTWELPFTCVAQLEGYDDYNFIISNMTYKKEMEFAMDVQNYEFKEIIITDTATEVLVL